MMRQTSSLLLFLFGLGTLAFASLGVLKNQETQAHKPGQTPSKQAPSFRLILSGHLDGKLEPCGCASAQSGGLDRRAFWLKAHQAEYDLALEGGNYIHEANPLEEEKFMTTLMVLGATLHYPILPLGARDLNMGIQDLLDFHEAFGPPFLASDVYKKTKGGMQALFGQSYRIVNNPKAKVLVLSIAGRHSWKIPKDLRVLPPPEAIEKALNAAKGKSRDLVVCFLHSGGGDAATKLAKEVEGVDLIISVDGSHETKTELRSYRKKSGRKTYVLFPGSEGRYLLKADLLRAAKGWELLKLHKIQVPALQPKIPGTLPPGTDPETHRLLKELRVQISKSDLLEKMAERKEPQGGNYVGSQACASCHKKADEVWKKTHHSKAFETLLRRAKEEKIWSPARHPDCVVCHSVGYGERSGFRSEAKTPELMGVGCEACHGPSSRHLDFWKKWKGKTPPKRDVEKAKTPKQARVSCYTCHTFEQSPGFDFQERWKKIRHK
jgi:hypothetical protein